MPYSAASRPCFHSERACSNGVPPPAKAAPLDASASQASVSCDTWLSGCAAAARAGIHSSAADIIGKLTLGMFYPSERK